MAANIEHQVSDRLLSECETGSVVSRQSSFSSDDEADIASPKMRLSTFERVMSTHAPIFESFLLQAPTDTIFQLYHTSRYLRDFLRSYPTAWQYLSFRLPQPGTTVQVRPTNPATQQSVPRQSRPYALDQLLLQVVVPFSPSLRSLDLDNTAVSGQNLTSTVLNMRRETLEHLSVRGCKNVSLKYHIIPYLMMFGLQYDAERASPGYSPPFKRLALKSLYTYRCRHHRRRPYLTSSLLRRDSDSEPTHELVKLCHKLGIWTDTAWCTTPAGRCYRRKGYVAMRAPQGTPEVWVVFDRLWRSRNCIGPSSDSLGEQRHDGRLWEQDETGNSGEALGTVGGVRGEGKTVPTHLRRSHRAFVEHVKCDACGEDIHERCEQCSILMHCVGCRKTLCYSCAFDRPYQRPRRTSDEPTESFWWAPGATITPCLMQEPNQNPSPANANNNPNAPPPPPTYPTLKFHWCCTEPVFTGGGGISLGAVTREVDRVRAVPLPRKQGWEDPEFASNEWSKSFPKYAYGDPKRPDYSLEEGHAEMMRWLLGPPDYEPSGYPRNLCQDCFESPQWKVHCKSCSRPLCMEHDLRGLRLGICGYRDLHAEKDSLKTAAESAKMGSDSVPVSAASPAGPSSYDLQLSDIDHTTMVVDDMSSSMIPEPPSRSTSNINTGSSSPSVYFEATQDAPKWVGCQSFFCPSVRALGDQRQRCTSVLKECSACKVRVCQDCIQANPPCKCSYCDINYFCPNCHEEKVRDGSCRHAEEERKRQEDARKQDLERFTSALERNLANEVAAFAGQFFNSLELNEGASSATSILHAQHQTSSAGPSTLVLPPTQYVPPPQQGSPTQHINQVPTANLGLPPAQFQVFTAPNAAPVPAPAPVPVPGQANYDEDEQVASASDHTEDN